MARIRSIKPEFFSHEGLAATSAHARLLAIGLLTLADCEGRLRWVPMQVHAQVFPWEAMVKIEVLLGELISCGYVVHWEHDGKRYVAVVNFRKHQRLSGKEAEYESRLPEPPGESQKTNELPSENSEAIGKHPDDSLGSTRNPLGTGEQGNIGTGEHSNKSVRKRTQVYSEDFQKFWSSFPESRRTKKKDAFRCWKLAIASEDPARLIARAVEYSQSDSGRGQYAVMPSVWLNSGMWDDDEAAWKSGPERKKSGPVDLEEFVIK